ncbi:phosphatidylglycerophosphatase A [Rhodovulum imhoffii]|uniref:Phosphatidylglycerophosphatase A n=1 Tax=Rhodovulum imhoffii TaxID=365340 RepID=A0A2T5BTB0_9RHOB|nr:phosphatidylglycerophosphatase A [Rhodovulum imhoffii]MBK5932991.1 phosphatidylglycerophosphatase A [Rhodovulum imhoffii]PTN02661.1 phosphatidylglycerophosphatase A [Rhodovulum imhoffii]
MSRLVATLFGVGHLRPAPGTWGSLAALPLFWVLHVLGGVALVVHATIAVTVIGWWAVAQATYGTADPDKSEFVIDEVAGMWVALWPVSIGATLARADILALYPGWIAAFLCFRLFDIVKPGPIGWADRRKTPLGVMLDDIFAGIAAATVVLILAFLWHKFLM